MLNESTVVAMAAVKDLAEAKQFYGETLGLNVTDNPMGLIELQIEGSNNIIIYSKPNHTPATFTILNFPVNNIDEAVEELKNSGVEFERYDEEFMKTDEKGIARGIKEGQGPDIAWFKDPAGNFLSVLQEG